MPRLPDPKMNPNGERSIGIVSNEANGHYDIYIKEDNGTPNSSRYYTTGTWVNMNPVLPAFLIRIKKVTPAEYESAEFKKGYPDPNLEAELYNKVVEAALALRQLINENPLLEIVTEGDGWPTLEKEARPAIVDYTERVQEDSEKLEAVRTYLNNCAFTFFEQKDKE